VKNEGAVIGRCFRSAAGLVQADNRCQSSRRRPGGGVTTDNDYSQSLVEYAQEGGVDGGFAKELEPSGGAVQRVVNVAG
jgi:hypothetical protein